MPFPRPDRSTYSPNFTKTPENDCIDIGWAEGMMSNDRPFRAECWAQDQVTCLSIMFARGGLESATSSEIADMLEVEGVVTFISEKKYVDIRPFRDDSDNDLLLINVVIADESQLYAQDKLSLQRWQVGA
jgi:hypothetical protein